MALLQSQKDYFDNALNAVTGTTSIGTFFNNTKNPPDTVTPPGPRQTFVEGMNYLSQRTGLSAAQKDIITNTLSSLIRDADFF